MRSLALVIAVCGCAGAPAPAQTASDPVLLRWSVSQGMWGTEELVVRDDGAASYSFTGAGESSPSRAGQAQLSPGEIDSLRAHVVSYHACDLRPTHELGVPDEGRPTLELGFAQQRCRIQMWDRDWNAGGAAVQGLVQSLRDRIAPAPEE